MAKDYGRKRSSQHRGSVSKQLLLALTCFLSGYLSASFFDFASLIGWINAELLAGHVVQTASKPVPQQAQLPKPKFEFYTLLASDHVETTQPAPSGTQVVAALPLAAGTTTVPMPKNQLAPGPMQVTVVSAKPIPMSVPVTANKGSYLVQVASFKSRQEAERVKASLTLKGFMVNVTMITSQRVSWYRVIIGPFASRMDAQKAQVSVARSEHIMGMIRKMDA